MFVFQRRDGHSGLAKIKNTWNELGEDNLELAWRIDKTGTIPSRLMRYIPPGRLVIFTKTRSSEDKTKTHLRERADSSRNRGKATSFWGSLRPPSASCDDPSSDCKQETDRRNEPTLYRRFYFGVSSVMWNNKNTDNYDEKSQLPERKTVACAFAPGSGVFYRDKISPRRYIEMSGGGGGMKKKPRV